jgi:serine phosphatase RsbU (regulator of sigma subunit)
MKSVDTWFTAGVRPLYEASDVVIKWFSAFTAVHDTRIIGQTNTHVLDILMQGYLLKAFPSVKGLKFDAVYKAANILEKLGGDWYDTFVLPDGRVGFSIGDVCGHGIDAAVKMGEAKQALFVAACLDDSAPEKVLRKANDVLFLNKHHLLTTALYGVVDTKRRTVTYASAGHHPPMLAQPNKETLILPDHGFPLGVEKNLPLCKTHVVHYELGQMMILYTDGLIEFSRDIFKGEALLLAASAEAVRCKPEHPAQYITDHVLGDAKSNDDIAVLTIVFEEE